jgi:hypothetical protein
MSDPQVAARRVAEATDRAWHGAGGGTEGAVCLGVVAALSLLARADPEGPDPRERILGLGDEEVARLLGEVWALFTVTRPELAFRCGPFGEWLNAERPPSHLLAGAGAVARAAVKAGLLDLTLDLGVARRIDLLGTVHTLMRSHGARSARGEFYTPPALAEMMARMTLGGLAPGRSICDPTAGTGGLLRGAAAAIRDGGGDPADYVWYGCDISAVAVAALAVNCHLWGLGRQVVIGCADTLAEPDWEVRALREREEAVAAQSARMRTAYAIGAARELLEALPGEGPEEGR